MLSIAELRCERNGNILFDNIGLTLFPGAVLCVYGKNGQGKTSLLRILAALAEPAKGQVLYNQCDIKDSLDEYFSLIAYVGHQNALDLDCTVYENLLFWARIYNMEEGLNAAIAYFELEEHRLSPVKTLSAGWQRRVELAKLLLNQAVVWLLDEPFVNLDKDGIKKVLEMINARCSQNGIVIFTAQHESNLVNLKAINFYLGDFSV